MQELSFKLISSQSGCGGEWQIRAISKIKKGEEICVSYLLDGLDSMNNRKERQDELLKTHDFICSCERCQDEEINQDDETYEKFKKLYEGGEKRGKKAKDLLNLDIKKSLDFMEKAISCQKQMYNLAENKKTTKGFITANIIPEWWYQEINRYGIAKQMVYERGMQEFLVKMEYFKGECIKLAKIVYELELTSTGKDSKDTKKWKERYEDFDNWCKKSGLTSYTVTYLDLMSGKFVSSSDPYLLMSAGHPANSTPDMLK